MGLKISDIITETCEGQRIESWYKLLADNISRKKSIRIISDEEAEKVRSFKSIVNAHTHTHMYTYIHVHNYTVLVACTSVTIVLFLAVKEANIDKLKVYLHVVHEFVAYTCTWSVCNNSLTRDTRGTTVYTPLLSVTLSFQS